MMDPLSITSVLAMWETTWSSRSEHGPVVLVRSEAALVLGLAPSSAERRLSLELTRRMRALGIQVTKAPQSMLALGRLDEAPSELRGPGPNAQLPLIGLQTLRGPARPGRLLMLSPQRRARLQDHMPELPAGMSRRWTSYLKATGPWIRRVVTGSMPST